VADARSVPPALREPMREQMTTPPSASDLSAASLSTAGLSAAELGELAGFAARLADAAGGEIRPHFRKLTAVDSKADASPVTIADRGAEQAMRDLIATHYPDHGVFGEEFGVSKPNAALMWILDPIDGTKSFVAGMPIFATVIALVDAEGFALGVIDQPIVGDRWVGVRGIGTAQNGTAARTRRGVTIADAVMVTTSIEFLSPTEREACERLLDNVRLFRLCGDAYAYGLLASGLVDLVLDGEVKPYDFAGLVAVVEGAGGVITDWQGQPLPRDRNSRVLAAGDPALHAAALSFLTGV